MSSDGLGIGLIPLVLVRGDLAEGKLRQLDTELDLPPLELTVSYPQKPESHLAAVVAELAIEIARDFPLTAES